MIGIDAYNRNKEFTVRCTNNSLEATQDFQLMLRDESDMAGFPASFLARVAANMHKIFLSNCVAVFPQSQRGSKVTG